MRFLRSETKKRVCIDLTPFEMMDRHGGIARYGAHLLRELLELPGVDHSKVEFCALTRADQPPLPGRDALSWAANPGEEIPVRVHQRMRRRRAGRCMKRAKVDLFHAIDPNHLPIRRPFLTVATCHDQIPLVFPSKTSSPRWLRKRRVSERKRFLGVDHVIADSSATKHDLTQELGLPDSHITVVHLGVDQQFFSATAARPRYARRRELPDRYFISVGSDYYRKNQQRLAEAWCRILDKVPEGLVFVGRALYEDTFEKIERDLRARGLGDRFFWLSDVADEELPELYRGATAAVAPSLYEGFGMTLLEAMASGSPVVASDNPAYREVANEAASYFDGTSVEQIADRLLEISRDDALRKQLVERGWRRTKLMTWRRTAEQSWAVYERLLWPERSAGGS